MTEQEERHARLLATLKEVEDAIGRLEDDLASRNDDLRSLFRYMKVRVEIEVYGSEEAWRIAQRRGRHLRAVDA